ncbi:hypothetical protein E4U17_000711 [Claviceps sp. LM77 group G4]|nr:hypothetical protein E4U17_000711 [Claviceps sp. LM77 group G4]KAG6077518.1 hypothetical protein E4U33_001243 [Claviceps sp. LM78 group G4]KAG6084766.1 hypothetical protein E4U16_001133 [Claviceps sp. LM84 group G4]
MPAGFRTAENGDDDNGYTYFAFAFAVPTPTSARQSLLQAENCKFHSQRHNLKNYVVGRHPRFSGVKAQTLSQAIQIDEDEAAQNVRVSNEEPSA